MTKLYGGVLSFEYTFSEFNILYHFDDLNTQFTYLNEKYLKYEHRLTNTIKTLNDIQSDLMLILEYDNNKRSGAYLNSRKVLEEQLVETVEYFWKDRPDLIKSLIEVEGKKGGGEYIKECEVFAEIYQEKFNVPNTDEDINKTIEKLATCKVGLKEKAVKTRPKEFPKDKLTDEESKASMAEVLWKKLLTLTKAGELFLSKAEGAKYRMVGFDKKCGLVLEGDQVIAPDDPKNPDFGKCIFENYVPETTRLQSNVVFYNTDKFELLPNSIALGHFMDNKLNEIYKSPITDKIYPEIYTVKEGESVLTQNFGVYLLKYKDKNIKEEDDKNNKFGLIFVATHFKAKMEGYVARQKLARSIKAVVANIKKTLKEWDVIVSGDLNAEIGEIAMDFNEPIIRLEDQMADKFTYKPSLVFVPNNPEKVIIPPPLDKNELTQFQEYLADIFKNPELAQNKKLTDLKGIDRYDPTKLEVKEPYTEKKIGEASMTDLKDYWIELNNYPTELKARVKEYDYTEHGYDKCLNTEITSNPDPKLTEDINSLKKSHMYQKIIDMMGEKDKASILEIIKSGSDNPESSKKLFAIFLANRKSWMEKRKIAVAKYLQAKIAKIGWTPSAHNKGKDCFSDLFEAEKIDFILYKPCNAVIIEIFILEFVKECLESGFPGKKFSSDHLPSKVKITLDLNKKFDRTNPILSADLIKQII